MVVLFPLRVEARPFLRKLSARAAPVASRRAGCSSYRFEFDGRSVTVIIAGVSRSVLSLPATGLAPPGADIVLAGVAKALNPRFQIGDVFAVTSVKKEGQPETLFLLPPRASSLPAASMVTCDRVVFRTEDAADLADMEGYYAARLFPGLMIIRAVSDREEDLEFLNACVRKGRFNRLSRWAVLRRLTLKRALTLLRFRRGLRLASRNLAAVLFEFCAGDRVRS
jgi:hypothetical protein